MHKHICLSYEVRHWGVLALPDVPSLYLIMELKLMEVCSQMHRTKSVSPRLQIPQSIWSLKSTTQTPRSGAYLGLQFLNLCFCNCMFDLQLKIEKKKILN